MALVSNQLLADPAEKKSRQDLHWYREDCNPPVVVTLLGVNLYLPDRDNVPSPVGRDDPRVPNGTEQCANTGGRRLSLP